MGIQIELTPEQVQALLDVDAGNVCDLKAYSDAMVIIADAVIDYSAEQDRKAGLFADCGKYD